MFFTDFLYKALLKKRQLNDPAQVFSSEFCKIFKSTYFDEHLSTAAPEWWKQFFWSKPEFGNLL